MDWAAVEPGVWAGWGLRVQEQAPVDTALNSRVLDVRTTAGRVIPKLVSERDPFVAGLEVAVRIARHIRSGPPLRTQEGELALETDNGWLAVLRREPGRPLRLAEESDRRRWGGRLGDLHRRLIDIAITEPLPVSPWDWLDVDADHLRGETALRDVIGRTRETAERFVERHHPEISVIHGDPNPQEFILDPAGDVAVVDWGAVLRGPLLYDVASARRFAAATSPPASTRRLPAVERVACPARRTAGVPPLPRGRPGLVLRVPDGICRLQVGVRPSSSR